VTRKCPSHKRGVTPVIIPSTPNLQLPTPKGIGGAAFVLGVGSRELGVALMDTSIDAGRLLRFESFELDVRSRELRKGKDRIRLQEQPFEILRMMLERPGDVVTREELAKRLWPEGTFVDFEHSLNAAVKRLRSALGDDADNPRFVETLPRRGYRFIAPLAGNGIARTSPVSPDYKARLAVLPFTNSSGEAGQEYFSEGLTEEMIMQLGRLGRGRIGVIARWSSMAFKGGTRRAREIGESLRADYLLEGSVRREGDRVRITAWLVETSSETHLWTDVYERHLTDCLSVQADVAARIAGSLAIELLPEQPLRPSRDVAAYQSYLKGRYYWNTGDEGLGQALHYFNQARESDPGLPPRSRTWPARRRRGPSATTPSRGRCSKRRARRRSVRWNSIGTCPKRISRMATSGACCTGTGKVRRPRTARRCRSIQAARPHTGTMRICSSRWVAGARR